MSTRTGFFHAALLLLSGCAGPASLDQRGSAPPANVDVHVQLVMQTERAFAATMANRDLDAFAGFLADEVIFLTSDGALRGREAVEHSWAPYFEGDQAPFSWSPARVEVLDSGALALSTGPVLDPEGACVGTFTSIWQRADDGSWKIVFDRGSSACDEG